jgi:hypothetical protein
MVCKIRTFEFTRGIGPNFPRVEERLKVLWKYANSRPPPDDFRLNKLLDINLGRVLDVDDDGKPLKSDSKHSVLDQTIWGDDW